MGHNVVYCVDMWMTGKSMVSTSNNNSALEESMNIHYFDQLFFDSGSVLKRTLLTGEYVFYKGDPANHIYAVESGQVHLKRPTPEGRSVLIHVAGDGGSFAEAALFASVYHCDAVAVQKTTIHTYPKKLVLEALRSQPDKTEQYITLLSSQVRSLRTQLELRNILSAKERIIHYLLLKADPATRELIFHMPLKEIASELGLARETFYRNLAQLEKEGIIKRQKKKILLCGENMTGII